MTQTEALLEQLKPIGRFISSLNLGDPVNATKKLDAAYPLSELASLKKLALALNTNGQLTPKNGGPGITFGRIAKPSDAFGGCSVDAVDMMGAALGHTHPTGEVSLCFALSGQPTFFGCASGWLVAPPASHHVPTVQNGRMLIFYFLPNGEMIWDR